jgi:hypothetical protein
MINTTTNVPPFSQYKNKTYLSRKSKPTKNKSTAKLFVPIPITS